jgi:threonine dehydrogenase-like Zn-dependent dehydrogenase
MIYRDEFPAAIDLLKRGEIKTGLFISEIHPLDELPRALENFRSPRSVKTLIQIP